MRQTFVFKRILLLAVLFIPFFSPSVLTAFVNDDLYDSPGRSSYREGLSSIPEESIDPFTGGLTLNHIDATLPGNGGLDLVIQRTFNSKNICTGWTCMGATCSCSKGENSWLGYGWLLHFGRLFKSNNVNVPHIIEMSDGSRHTTYMKNASTFITRDFWLLSTNGTPVLTLTNGTKIYFSQSGPSLPNSSQHSIYYATKIQDVNGNTINIYYRSPGNLISYITDSVGRKIVFNAQIINGSQRLTSITGPGINISYAHQRMQAMLDTILTKVTPPLGDSWEYTYNGLELQSIKSPYGGILSYSYDFSRVKACGTDFFYRTLVKKSAGGKNIPQGTWNLSYSQGTNAEYTIVADPCGRTIRYSYYGYGSRLNSGSMWKLGLPKSKEIVGEETSFYDWTSQKISTDDFIASYCGRDSDTYSPLLSSYAVSRDGKTYTTNYANYDNYGNPRTISESGDQARTFNKSYWYETTKNIVQNKTSSETVSGSFPGTSTTKYSYDSRGNLTTAVKGSLITKYSYHSNGNLSSSTDPNGYATTYQWSKGRISKTTNPVYTVSRSINDNGTIASETDGRGNKTNLSYDKNLRITKIEPPTGNTTTFTYPSNNSYRKQTRGDCFLYSYYDGFGRPAGISDSKGVDAEIEYKSCGPKEYSASNIGDKILYDNFDRTIRVTHKDGARIKYSFSGSNVTVTDEVGNESILTYNAFGTPDEKYLVDFRDSSGKNTRYEWNILGSLQKITQGSTTRTYAYDTDTNFLISETHPECGTIKYTRDKNGNMISRTDGSGTNSYTYDKLSRLVKILSGGTTIFMTYDNADNKTSVTTPAADMDYVYDAANRLTQKIAGIAGRTYSTRYDYDADDNLIHEYYPTGTWITYGYNENNQVSNITGFGGNVSNITYNAAGLPTKFAFSNGISTDITYTDRNFTRRITAGNGTSSVYYEYGYDTRGNTISITNTLDASKNQRFTYDSLNRMSDFNGSWGNGSFSYDATGNRTGKKIGSAITSYSYNSNRLNSISGAVTASYSYNGYGDLTSLKKGTTNYNLTYDNMHNLKSYKAGTISLAEFAYDGDGMRVTKKVGGSTIVYHHDNNGRVISETDDKGNTLFDYIYLNDRLIARKSPSAVYFYHTDAAGTPLAMTSAMGGIAWHADYRPFGEEQAVAGATENNQKFVGKEKDKETGFYYFGARYMEPEMGRFTSIDAIGPVDSQTGQANNSMLGNPQRLNRYAYSLNNPYRYSDNNGQWPEEMHSRIIREAFGRKYGFSEKLLSIMMKGSVHVDEDQSIESSYKHAMSCKYYDAEKAEEYSKLFTMKKVAEYKELLQQGKTDEAYFALGEAMHPIMDSTSPSHTGFQEWNSPWSHPLKAWIHMNEESADSFYGNALHLEKSVQMLRKFYEENR